MNDYGNNNPYFQQLLEIFDKGYIPVYNNHKVVTRKSIRHFTTRNFNIWYFSQTLSVSPACFVNSYVYNEMDTRTVAFPQCRPVYSRDKLMEFSYAFRAFTLDNHPFLQDMGSFFEKKKTPRPYLGHEGFAYRETIIAVCEKLSLHQKENIKEFLSLPAREKLNMVVDVMISRFVDALDNISLPDKRPTAQDVHTALQSGKMLKTFLADLFGNLNKSAKNFTKTTETQLFSICCTHFFTPFGQYLQLIQPEYKDIFEFTSTDEEFLAALDKNINNEIEAKMQTIYFSPPDGYNITPLGAAYFGIDFSPSTQPFPLLPPGNYQAILNGMVEEVEHYENAEEEEPQSLIFNPLEGLNPEDLPICTNERVNYTFKVRRKTITMKGTDTLEDFADTIQRAFGLNGEHSSSFYMNAKLFEPKHEIHCKSTPAPPEGFSQAKDFKIHQLGLHVQQKFVYLYDFDTEQKFSISFVETS